MTLPILPALSAGDDGILMWGTLVCGHTLGYHEMSRRILGTTWHCPLCGKDRQLVWREWVVSGLVPVPRYPFGA